MGFAHQTGYTPATVEAIMLSIMENVNEQFGTSYTAETFIGSGFYKTFYTLVQRVQENEIKTSEIFLKLQDYFRITNEQIARPVVTNPGLLEHLENNDYVSSIKKPIDADAGKVFVCVDVDESADDYDDTRLAICTLIKDSTIAGIVTQGTESESITLTNGQNFDFKFNLPDRISVLLKLTIETSENNQFVIKTPDEIKQDLLNNINSRYRLGKNFEPQRYYSLVDAPWASNVLLEWSDDAGMSYDSTVFNAEYDELFDISLEDIELVET